MSKRLTGFLLFLPVLILCSSCQSEHVFYSITSTPPATASAVPGDAPTGLAAGTEAVPITGPSIRPADLPPPATRVIYDVKSARNAAPYGDSYDINRLERPFLQDMSYVPDLDIVSFEISEDADWYYLSILLAGRNPNHLMGINYGVELDLDRDGFGDTLIRAFPPYTSEWTTNWVQVYNDSNRDSAGTSSAKADAAFDGNGYETLVFDGRWGEGADPSLAWVRIKEGPQAVVQFAFKKTLAAPPFLFGALADGGLKDVSRLDYNDHFHEAEAGSPLEKSRYYPLRALFAVDNTCWQAFGMKNPSQIGKVCPLDLSAPATGLPQITPVP